jgi:glycerol-3-phosphate dehydrogenase
VLALTEADPTLGASLAPGYPDIAAQVAFSVRYEWTERLEDFMLRRSYLGFAPDRGAGAADAVSHRMQRELQWSEDRRQSEVRTYLARVERDLLPVRTEEPAYDTHRDTSGMVEMERSI